MKQRRLMNDINVVPYIDVMLVLLVIFMVTAPMVQSSSVNLPSVGASAQTPSAPLEVIVHADGTLAVRDRADESITGGKEKTVDRTELVDFIRQLQAKNPQQPVLIAGDKNVKYDAVLRVMDELQRQHVQKIGLLVQPSATR
ncbi:MAG: protein TolR [Rugosibacter sp.]|jgi:biopolymer transport protein TolR|nr:biopolymer transport protein TolR [Rugosibacter sp.]